MESQKEKNQPIEIRSVFHISEEEFLSLEEEPEERSDTFPLPPLPDLIPIADLQPPVWSNSLLEDLLECPLCTHQICPVCQGTLSLVSKVNCLKCVTSECHDKVVRRS